MHLVCPKCATSYQLEGAAIGVEGRSVRCVRCKNVWFATATEPAGAAVEEAAFREELGAGAGPAPGQDSALADRLVAVARTVPQPDDASEATNHAADTSHGLSAPIQLASQSPEMATLPAASALQVPAMDAPPLVPTASGSATGDSPTKASEPEDVESVAARRMPNPKNGLRRRLPTPKSRLPLVILVLVAACAAIIGWRKDIVRHMPQMASFYGSIGLPVNVRGIVFTDIRLTNDTHDGIPVLTVDGAMASVVAAAVEVPRLRFALRDATGQEVYSWTAMPTQTVLAPGETLPFRSRLASPPGNVHDVQVRFFNRRDAAAGPH